MTLNFSGFYIGIRSLRLDLYKFVTGTKSDPHADVST